MSRAARALMWLASVAVTVISLLYLVDEFTRVDTMVGMGDIWSLLNLDAQRLGVFTEIDPDDYLGPPLPEVGDTLVSVNGLAGTRENYFRVFNPDTPAGQEMQLEFKRADSVYTTTIRARSIPSLLRIQYILLFCLRAALTLGMLLAGFWAFARKPSSIQVSLLALFCYSIVCLMIIGQPIINVAYSRFVLPSFNVLLAVVAAIGAFSGPLWMHLNMVFPHPRRGYMRWKGALLPALYLPPLGIGVLQYLGVTGLAVPVTVFVLFCFTAGYLLLARTLRRAPTHLEKRQARLVLWGSAPGVGLLGLLVLSNAVFPGWQNGIGIRLSLAVNNLLFLVLLLIPATFAWAFGRYRLMEVESRLRRGTLFLLVNTVLIAILALFIYGLGWFLMRVLSTDSTVPIVAVSVGLALGIAPAQRRIRASLEDRIYPERRRLRDLLKGFLAFSREISEDGPFWIELDSRLREGLGTRAVYPVLPGRQPDLEDEPWMESPPFRNAGSFMIRICQTGRPMHTDEIIASGRFELTQDEKLWLERKKVAILIPLATSSGPLGFIAAEGKENGEDYTLAEMDMLASLADQVAVAADNISLLGEKVEKEKLEKQLEIARDIQVGFLPREVPSTPGLEVSCRILFCLQVAGDFYDIRALGDGRTLLAAGDATGKGVGPALLVANLQASLRAIATVSLPLADEIGRLNDLLCDSTPEDFFITLFVTVFDPSTGEIRWVNAGHNPPLLLRADGSVEKLSDGGLLLGVRMGEAYAEGSSAFREGDMLLMYTDGVSEAMDPDGVEYGELRILDLVTANRGRSTGEIVELLEQDVRKFHGADSFEDDVTIVLCRRVQTGPAREGRSHP
jgi:serine phosphatase RsbU (regulator of sigma subunit)